MKPPVFWPTSDRTCAIQTHTIEDRRKVAKMDGTRKIAYSVAGPMLDVFEINRSYRWALQHLPNLISGSKPVSGGSWDEFWVKELATPKAEETPT